MKRSVQKRDPAGRIQPSQGDEPTKVLASPKPSRQRSIPVEDEQFIIAIIGIVLMWLILTGGAL